MNTYNFKDCLEMAQYFAVILGIITALFQYIRSERKNTKDKEYETYNASDEKYIDYLKLCLDHPDLDVFDIPDGEVNNLKDEREKKSIIMFTILFSIFERAYITYKDKSRKIKKEQYNGWIDYMVEFVDRENFKEAWKISGKTFQQEFQYYMNTKILNNKKRA
jgi:hypothetical protein